MNERHCEHWESWGAEQHFEQSDRMNKLSNSEPLPEKIRDLIREGFSLIASPGHCKAVDNDHVISECVCYTCPKNTLTLGYGYNGQGA